MSSIPSLGSSTPLTGVCTPDRNKKKLWSGESAELQYAVDVYAEDLKPLPVL